MTISEIAEELSVALGNRMDAKERSVEERIFFHLLVECFRRRDCRQAVGNEANDFSEWMALLVRNTGPQADN